jgi:hypothetical protein
MGGGLRHKNYQGAPSDGSSWVDSDCLARHPLWVLEKRSELCSTVQPRSLRCWSTLPVGIAKILEKQEARSPALLPGVRERPGGRRRACALFLSRSVSAVTHAADVSRSVLAIGTKGRIYCTHSAALHGRVFDLDTAISVIDLETC